MGRLIFFPASFTDHPNPDCSDTDLHAPRVPTATMPASISTSNSNTSATCSDTIRVCTSGSVINTVSSTLSKSGCFASSASTNPATVTQAEWSNIGTQSGNQSINRVDQREPKIVSVYRNDQLPGKIIEVQGDGHCLLRAVNVTLQYLGMIMTHLELCEALISEVVFHKKYYEAFETDTQDIISGLCKFIFNKEYNTATSDILVAALCNALSATAVIYQFQEATGNYTETVQAPGRPGVISKNTFYLVRTGENLSAHYSALVDQNQLEPQAMEDSNLVLQSPTEVPLVKPDSLENFSPEIVKPHPKAPRRKDSAKGRKRRKTTILTDTPEKEALEQEKRNREARSKPADKGKKKQASRELKAAPKKKLKYESESSSSADEQPDYFCLVCLATWKQSREGELWVQCLECRGWAHEECTGIDKAPIYICHNCDSDTDSVHAY